VAVQAYRYFTVTVSNLDQFSNVDTAVREINVTTTRAQLLLRWPRNVVQLEFSLSTVVTSL